METLKCLVTARQAYCLNLLALGSSNREIGRVLGLTEYSVKQIFSRIYRRLDVSGKTKSKRVVLARLWSCPIFRIGCGYEHPKKLRAALELIQRVDAAVKPKGSVAELQP